MSIDPAVAALLGAAIGALPGLLGPLLNARSERRKARLTLAAELGKADSDHFRAMTDRDGVGAYLPLSLYVWFHQQVLEELDAGTYGPEAIQRLEAEMDRLMAAYPQRR